MRTYLWISAARRPDSRTYKKLSRPKVPRPTAGSSTWGNSEPLPQMQGLGLSRKLVNLELGRNQDLGACKEPSDRLFKDSRPNFSFYQVKTRVVHSKMLGRGTMCPRHLPCTPSFW